MNETEQIAKESGYGLNNVAHFVEIFKKIEQGSEALLATMDKMVQEYAETLRSK